MSTHYIFLRRNKQYCLLSPVKHLIWPAVNASEIGINLRQLPCSGLSGLQSSRDLQGRKDYVILFDRI